MEMEAKLRVPNARVAAQLRGLKQLGDYALGAPREIKVRDTFYDTAARHLSKRHITLRLRLPSTGSALVTVKRAAKQRGAIHHRPEIEGHVSLSRAPARLAPQALPRPVRAALPATLRDESFLRLLTNTQERTVRTVRQGRRTVAEWSLDRVQFRADGRTHTFIELEIERKGGGTRVDLVKLVALLVQAWNLQGVTSSKFARALAFADLDSAVSARRQRT